MTKNSSAAADTIILCLVLGLQRPNSHTSQSWARSNLNKPLEVEASEKDVLCLNPSHGRCELIGQQFNEDSVCESLTVLVISPVITFPALQYFVETWRRGLIVDHLSVFTRNLEWFRDQVRDVLSDKHVGVDLSNVDLL